MTTIEGYELQNDLDLGVVDDIAPSINEADYTPPRHRYRTVVHLNHRYAEGIYA